MVSLLRYSLCQLLKGENMCLRCDGICPFFYYRKECRKKFLANFKIKGNYPWTRVLEDLFFKYIALIISLFYDLIWKRRVLFCIFKNKVTIFYKMNKEHNSPPLPFYAIVFALLMKKGHRIHEIHINCNSRNAASQYFF